MPTEFRTFGPFTVRHKAGVVTRDDLNAMWADMDNDGLSDAIGVYIFFKQNGKASAKPWYVGRTDRGFRKRFFKHVGPGKTFDKIAHVARNGSLQMYLLARVNIPSAAFTKPQKSHLKSIKMLEFLLIGMCLTRNKNLQNTSEKTFHSGFYVPGYLGNKPGRPSTAASGLTQLLNID